MKLSIKVKRKRKYLIWWVVRGVKYPNQCLLVSSSWNFADFLQLQLNLYYQTFYKINFFSEGTIPSLTLGTTSHTKYWQESLTETESVWVDISEDSSSFTSHLYVCVQRSTFSTTSSCPVRPVNFRKFSTQLTIFFNICRTSSLKAFIFHNELQIFSANTWEVKSLVKFQQIFICSKSAIEILGKRCETQTKLTIKTTKRRQWRHPGGFMLTLNIFHAFF